MPRTKLQAINCAATCLYQIKTLPYDSVIGSYRKAWENHNRSTYIYLDEMLAYRIHFILSDLNAKLILNAFNKTYISWDMSNWKKKTNFEVDSRSDSVALIYPTYNYSQNNSYLRLHF
jgi:hypothetical protein